MLTQIMTDQTHKNNMLWSKA